MKNLKEKDLLRSLLFLVVTMICGSTFANSNINVEMLKFGKSVKNYDEIAEIYIGTNNLRKPILVKVDNLHVNDGDNEVLMSVLVKEFVNGRLINESHLNEGGVYETVGHIQPLSTSIIPSNFRYSVKFVMIFSPLNDNELPVGKYEGQAMISIDQ